MDEIGEKIVVFTCLVWALGLTAIGISLSVGFVAMAVWLIRQAIGV